MNFMTRLRAAIGGWILGSKSLATWSSSWQNDVPAYASQDFSGNVKNGWYKNELIFACINKTANTAAQVRMKVFSNKTGLPIENHPTSKVISNPNPFMSEFDLWYSVIVFTKLAGMAVYEKERTLSGEIMGLWPLRPDWVKVVPSRQDFIGGYQYCVPGEQPRDISTKDVLVFKVFDPGNMYHGHAPVAVASRVGQVDNSSTDYIKLFFDKGGAPPGLLKTTQRLGDPQVAEIRKRWRERYGGWEHWMEPAILDRDASYQRIGLTFQEMGMGVLDSRNEARICMVLDVPPIIVGAKVGLDRATYANYKEARSAWWEDSLMPLYASFVNVVDKGVFQEMNTARAYLDWDMSKVPALQEERNSRWKRAKEALLGGGIMLNEYRAEIGLPGLGPKGDVFLRGAQVVSVGLDEAEEPAEEEPATDEELETDSYSWSDSFTDRNAWLELSGDRVNDVSWQKY